MKAKEGTVEHRIHEIARIGLSSGNKAGIGHISVLRAPGIAIAHKWVNHFKPMVLKLFNSVQNVKAGFSESLKKVDNHKRS